MIKLKTDHRCYIGSSKDIGKRIDAHFRRLFINKHHCIRLQRCYNKYGKENFEIIVINLCEIQDLKTKEKYYIDLHDSYNTGLNSTPVVFSGNIGFKHSQETKQKISKNNARYWKGKRFPKHVYEASKEALKKRRGIPRDAITKEKIKNSHLNNGYFHSKETKEKISKNLKGKTKGKKLSEETKKKIGIGNKGKKRTTEFIKQMSLTRKGKYMEELHPKSKEVNQFSKEGIFMKTWSCATEVQRILNIKQANISKVCLNLRNYAGGFKWQFANKDNPGVFIKILNS